MAQKAKKKSKLRHAEYYDMQKTFDSLYADSKSGEVFGHLMDIISAPSNIKLAFRNIKGNDGSHTAGTDGRTIESLAVMPEDKFVKLIQKQFRRYEPKAVKRVEIPKPNGKMRPLGIPCIIDRIVQQCILQVMEPICEAKFYEHSYGFRPCRSAENAISYAYGLAQRNKLHYVVDVDVKGFFDNVDHRKLLKQIWTLGIRDTKLIQIIKAMLKAPIEMPDGENVLPSKGTPQGGILSPLLANIVLNELDWWIASQWDEMVRHMKHPCKVTYYPNGAEKKCNSYTALKKSNLKEMRIVRYADDFKIFCRTKEDAEKTYYAVKDWLWKRQKLEVSDEKSKVTNLRKRDSEFLGFRIKLRRKSNSWVITSNVCDKAIHRISKEMADSVKAIQSSKTAEEISLNVGDYNAKVIVTKDDIIICDPEGEYFPIVRAFNGQVVRISPTSHDYINPMDINTNYADDDDPLSLKSDFILSLCELVVGGKNGLEPVEKTIIDRCVRLVYQDYLADPVPEKMPILEDLYNLLRKQEEPEAQRLATALEIYVNGSLKVFNHRTNVELNNRLVCFDIKDLGKQLKKLGMLIVQDQVWNRVTVNRAAHKSTRYYIDEFHLLLKEEQTAAYSVEIWKRFRKWGGIPTGITQNVKDLLASREIENIFENSDFILMLNQASGDRQILAKQLNISPHQLSYVTNSGAGEGLIFYGNTIIPFKDRFDNSLMLYALMSSKPEDVEKREKLGIKDRDD